MNLNDLIVDEYTTPCLYNTQVGDSIYKAFDLMHENGVRHLPVLKGDKVVGIISDRDLSVLGKIESLDDILVDNVMTPDPCTIFENTPLVDAAYTMSSKKIGSVLVNDMNGKFLGIFTSTDALNALIEILRGDLED